MTLLAFTLTDLVELLQKADVALTAASFATPVGLYAWGRALDAPRTDRTYGLVASSTVALGLITMVVAAATIVWLSGERDLMQVALLPMVAPFVFGFGGLWAATTHVPFDVLKEYAVLRRIWALLTLLAVVLVVYLVLKRTFLVVWTGIAGFLGLAIVAALIMRYLWSRVTDE